MTSLRAILNGAHTLTLDPSTQLDAYRRQMAEQDRRQREAWTKMLSQASRQASRRNG